ncbi:MAG: preprotein translocase subunit YajC [Hyphomicrobiales bacterium]|nr:preprotein translocase subunit YajC [Hyphomicrobiales bacterium]
MFISPAYAQAAGAAAPGSFDMITTLVPLVFVVVIMYFFMLRPQQQRAKALQAMISAVKRGDVVVTSGGLIGKITKDSDPNEVEVEIASNVRVRLQRAAITEVRGKGSKAADTAGAAS